MKLRGNGQANAAHVGKLPEFCYWHLLNTYNTVSAGQRKSLNSLEACPGIRTYHIFRTRFCTKRI